MELLYLYIGGREKFKDPTIAGIENSPYKVLKNVELNFSNRFIFSFNVGMKSFTLNENEQFIPNFYDKKGKIKNVTGIVGKNGTGKSSILELIMSIRKDNYHQHYYKQIIVFGEELVLPNGRIEYKFKIYYHPELNFETFTDLISCKPFFNEESKVSIKSIDSESEPLPNYSTIYYSTIFDIESTIKNSFLVYGTEKLENISTTKLLELDAEAHVNAPSSNMNATTVLKKHKLMETFRQIQFIYNVKDVKKYLEFETPKIIELTTDNFDEIFVKNNYKDVYDLLIQRFDSNIQSSSLTSKESFLLKLHRAAFFNTVRYLLAIPTVTDLDTVIDGFFSNAPSSESIRSFISHVGNYYSSDIFQEKSEFLNSFLNSCNKFKDTDFIVYGVDIKLFVDISNTEEYNIFEQYIKGINLSGFLLAEWRFKKTSSGEMSSGEKSLISLFSRFYSVYNKIGKEKPKSLLILIDEGDQLFHPEWQRQFINLLLNFITEQFYFAKTIQIILTTHSPFIVSDLPPFSVIKLHKNVNGHTIASGANENKSTFAANIHELFTDSFYLEKGLIGEFAKNKIENIFNSISKLNGETNETLLKEIALIAEPFIKASLIQLYYQKSSKRE